MLFWPAARPHMRHDRTSAISVGRVKQWLHYHMLDDDDDEVRDPYNDEESRQHIFFLVRNLIVKSRSVVFGSPPSTPPPRPRQSLGVFLWRRRGSSDGAAPRQRRPARSWTHTRAEQALGPALGMGRTRIRQSVVWDPYLGRAAWRAQSWRVLLACGEIAQAARPHVCNLWWPSKAMASLSYGW